MRPLAPRIDHVGISATRLHDLRLAYACAIAGDHDFASDESIVREIADPTHHLLWHCDCDGCYVPVDFDEAILDDIGSTRSPAARRCASARSSCGRRCTRPRD